MAPSGPPGGQPLTTVKQAALWSLGHYGVEARPLVPRIIGFLGDSNSRVRWAAADALKNIGPPAAESVPALEKLLGDKEQDVRARAAEALKKIQGEGTDDK